MEGKLAEVLRDHGHHTGVVRSGRHLAEYHFVAAFKELYAKDAVATEGPVIARQSRGHDRCGGSHGLWLPALAVVAALLPVAYRLAECGAADRAHGEKGYLVVEIYEAFHNHRPARRDRLP